MERSLSMCQIFVFSLHDKTTNESTSINFILYLHHFHFRFKNVLFEITSTANPAVFEVNCKFMGLTMEKVELVFQVFALNKFLTVGLL